MNLTPQQQKFRDCVLNNPTNAINAIWSESLTNDPNDCSIIVKGTSDEKTAIEIAKNLFKKDITDKNGCIAYTWGSTIYLDEFPNTVFVYMADVG
jgi:hypothetical protein